jgi:acetyl esterase/lipase
MNRTFTLLLLFTLLPVSNIFTQSSVKNYVYAEKDSSVLTMDVYFPDNQIEEKACIIFMFGGGFSHGSKSEDYNIKYCKSLAERGFVVSAIDYRLGLTGYKMNLKILKALTNAVKMAVEDLYSATNFILEHVQDFNVDPEMIIINGSSAGAITSLQADYELGNRRDIAAVLPDNFRYAGVISFAGAVLSKHWAPKYKIQNPAPTLFFHGTDDVLVPYGKIQIVNAGFFGTNTLVRQFKKADYPYCVFRYVEMGHEIAETPMRNNLDNMVKFIEDYVFDKRHLKIDITIDDEELKASKGKRIRPKDLY